MLESKNGRCYLYFGCEAGETLCVYLAVIQIPEVMHKTYRDAMNATRLTLRIPMYMKIVSVFLYKFPSRSIGFSRSILISDQFA